MDDRKKRVAAFVGLIVALFGVTAWFALRPAPAKPVASSAPVETGAAAAPSTAPAVETAAAAPTEAPSADEPPADSAAAPPSRGRGAAPLAVKERGASAPSAAPKEPPKEAAADAGAPAPSASASAAVAVKEPPPSPALVGQFQSRAGKQFRLVKVTATLDGQPVYTGTAVSAEMFRRAAGPGSHTLSIAAEYQGNGGGVFSYFDGYRFTVRANQSFSTKADAPTQITAAVVERGGQLTDFKDRLAVMINVR